MIEAIATAALCIFCVSAGYFWGNSRGYIEGFCRGLARDPQDRS